MNRLQAHHFFFSTSMWEILREHITPSRVADQNTAGFALILFARGLHRMKRTKKDEKLEQRDKERGDIKMKNLTPKILIITNS